MPKSRRQDDLSLFSGVFPFSAIRGQDAVCKALILNAVNPRVGGLLVCGEKGTAKSSAVRAFGNLLKQELVTIPLNITEDRLTGSLDMEKTIQSGKICFLPGLLYKAHNGMVYIDEVNLLPDHIVDILLNAAANRENHIEREGISYFHESNFILIGTMNLEEGLLRPQFLDRFGLCVYIYGVKDIDTRVEIARNVLAYEDAPLAFRQTYKTADRKINVKIETARITLKNVKADADILRRIADVCIDAHVEGHRADITLMETAKAVAAWDGRAVISDADLEEAAFFALPHRKKAGKENRKEHDENTNNEHHNKQDNDGKKESGNHNGSNDTHRQNGEVFGGQTEKHESGYERGGDSTGDTPLYAAAFQSASRVFTTGNDFKVRNIAHTQDKKRRNGAGRRTTVKSASRSGRYLYSGVERKNNDIALDATIRAASPFQRVRTKNGVAIAIKPEDIREKVRQKKIANLIVFAVDSSGSMGAQRRMEETKGAVLSLLKDAYIKRDKIALVAFRNRGAAVLLPPTGSVRRGYTLLQAMPTGGKTPLNAGLYRSFELVKSELRKDAEMMPILIVITDGRGNVSLTKDAKPREEMLEIGALIAKNKKITSLVIDIEKDGMMKMGYARELSASLNAHYFKIDDLKKDTLLSMVGNMK